MGPGNLDDVRIFRDGRPLSPQQAVVSVFDPGFLHGQAAFETVLARNGRPVALQAHLQRLAWSAGRMGLAWPHPGSSRDALRTCVEAAASETTGRERRALRVSVFPGVSGPTRWPQSFEAPSTLVLSRPAGLEPVGPVEVSAVLLGGSGHPVPDAKLHSYGAAWVALHQAREQGADEAIWHREGMVVEAPTANVMAHVDGVWVAPDPSDLALSGITRQLVLAALEAQGHEVQTRPLSVSDLQRASEVALTSSIRGVASVVRLDGRPVGTGRSGPAAEQLHRGLWAWVDGGQDQALGWAPPLSLPVAR